MQQKKKNKVLGLKLKSTPLLPNLQRRPPVKSPAEAPLAGTSAVLGGQPAETSTCQDLAQQPSIELVLGRLLETEGAHLAQQRPVLGRQPADDLVDGRVAFAVA